MEDAPASVKVPQYLQSKSRSKNERHGPFRLVPLDLPSETLVSWEQGEFTQTDYAAFELAGICDLDALREALRVALKDRPTFHANLIPVRYGFFEAWAWRLRDDPCPLEVRDLRHRPDIPSDLEAWTHEYFSDVVKRKVEALQNEYPVRFILVRLPADRFLFVIVFHHAATDGGGLYDFLRELFAAYHELVTGTRPAWSQVAAIHAQSSGADPKPYKLSWPLLKDTIVENWRHPYSQTIQMDSTSDGKPGRNMVRYVFEDRSFQNALRDRARRDGGTVSDLVLAASKLALQEWNESRNAPSDTMYHGLAVNQRARLPRSLTRRQGNPMSAVAIASGPEQRRDKEALLRYVIERRKFLMEYGFDVILARVGHGLSLAGRVLPLRVRYPVLRISQDHKISFFLTNLGVIWPEIADGRPTGDTVIRRIGDMEITDIHSSVAATKNNPMGLILRTFLGKLYFLFTFGRHRICDADARAFSDLLLKKTREYL